MIPYGRQTISEADIAAVVRVLQSDYLTQGSQVPAFESSLKNYCGAAHAVAVCNATAALHIACQALGLGKGDILGTTPITFVASAICALYCGATEDFVDIDPHTLNLSIPRLAEKLAAAQVSGCLPKIVIPVHLCGEPCDMAALHQLSQQYGFKIIEDASHAVGASYQGGKVGNCRYSDITVFSFHPVKIITTAEGGSCLTNSPELADTLARLRSHGITRNPDEMTHEPDGAWYYQQIELGYNYRMTELQAALGVSQMTRIDEFVARRHAFGQAHEMPEEIRHTQSPGQITQAHDQPVAHQVGHIDSFAKPAQPHQHHIARGQLAAANQNTNQADREHGRAQQVGQPRPFGRNAGHHF